MFNILNKSKKVNIKEHDLIIAITQKISNEWKNFENQLENKSKKSIMMSYLDYYINKKLYNYFQMLLQRNILCKKSILSIKELEKVLDYESISTLGLKCFVTDFFNEGTYRDNITFKKITLYIKKYL